MVCHSKAMPDVAPDITRRRHQLDRAVAFGDAGVVLENDVEAGAFAPDCTRHPWPHEVPEAIWIPTGGRRHADVPHGATGGGVFGGADPRDLSGLGKPTVFRCSRGDAPAPQPETRSAGASVSLSLLFTSHVASHVGTQRIEALGGAAFEVRARRTRRLLSTFFAPFRVVWGRTSQILSHDEGFRRPVGHERRRVGAGSCFRTSHVDSCSATRCRRRPAARIWRRKSWICGSLCPTGPPRWRAATNGICIPMATWA
eukprot:scaffold31_cov263-Pinguiococcus_pyrenoidosus.AAC.25